MSILRDSWRKLVELWDMAEIADIISSTLISIYMVEARLHQPEIDVKTLMRNIEKCRYVLSKLLEDLDMYMNGEAPETKLVSMIMEAYSDTNVKEVRNRLSRAIHGLEKLVKTISREPLDTSVLKDRDVIELEDVLKRLSDVLSRKIDRIANEMYTF